MRWTCGFGTRRSAVVPGGGCARWCSTSRRGIIRRRRSGARRGGGRRSTHGTSPLARLFRTIEQNQSVDVSNVKASSTRFKVQKLPLHTRQTFRSIHLCFLSLTPADHACLASRINEKFRPVDGWSLYHPTWLANSDGSERRARWIRCEPNNYSVFSLSEDFLGFLEEVDSPS